MSQVLINGRSSGRHGAANVLIPHLCADPRCRHGDNSLCLHCTALEPFDPTVLQAPEPPIKFLSFHSYLRKLNSGGDKYAGSTRGVPLGRCLQMFVGSRSALVCRAGESLVRSRRRAARSNRAVLGMHPGRTVSAPNVSPVL